VEGLAERVGAASVQEFHNWYAESVEQRIATGINRREPTWTESLAVGGKAFVAAMTQQYTKRRQFKEGIARNGSWYVRENPERYTTQRDKNVSANPPFQHP
jgi:hypothetical protein